MSKRRRALMNLWRENREAMKEGGFGLKDFVRANMGYGNKALDAWGRAKRLTPDRPG